MPIAPPPAVPLPAVPTPHVVPHAHKVTPVEPARRVTRNKDAERTEQEADEKRRREGKRGNLYDLEI